MARRIADPDRFVSLGFEAIDWIEHHLCHGPGDVQGEPLLIDDEMAAFIVKAYQLDPVTGRRKVNRAFLSRPKGRAKSELAGALVCFEALGPCRFDGWDAAGDPVGRPQVYPFIRCLATEENQSGNTYDNVTAMLEHLVEYSGDEFPGIDLGRSAQTSSRIFIEGGGEIVPSTSSGAAKDGGKETFSVFDETHLYVLPELRAMHKTVRRNLVKRRAAEPWSLETSTMYAVGENSVAEATHEYHKAVVSGRVRDGGLLFDHREAPHVEDLHDDDQLLPALEYVYGDAAPWMDLERIASDMREPDTDPADARRYFLNQPGTASAKAFDLARWRELADSRFIVPRRKRLRSASTGRSGATRQASSPPTSRRATSGCSACGSHRRTSWRPNRGRFPRLRSTPSWTRRCGRGGSCASTRTRPTTRRRSRAGPASTARRWSPSGGRTAAARWRSRCGRTRRR